MAELTQSQLEALEFLREETIRAEDIVYRQLSFGKMVGNFSTIYNAIVEANMDSENDLLIKLENEIEALYNELSSYEDGVPDDLIDYFYDRLESISKSFSFQNSAD
jgi:hypothetical protein